MNREKFNGKRIKELLARKTLPTILAGSMLLSSNILNSFANAYSLDEPTQGYEDFINYQGIKVFINGRYVEFNESTGYPFVMDGSTMIPLRAVSEAFGAKVQWNDYNKTASVSKYDTKVDVTVDSKEMKVNDLNTNNTTIRGITKEALVKDGMTYIPLRSLFECFGLSVRWDSEKQIAHIETINLEILENIDFKEEKIYTINELKEMKNVESIEYDGEKIDREYLGVLSESNQYIVITKDNSAKIFSYQFLSNLNYYYSKEKLLKKNSYYETDEKVILRDEKEEDIEFFKQLMLFNNYLNIISTSKRSGNIYPTYTRLNREQFTGLINEVKRIGNEIKSKTSDKKEQAIMINNYLNSNVEYNTKYKLSGAYEALVIKKSVCSGYALAYNMIANYLEIPCIHASGQLENYNKNHAWNEVYIDGEWYIFDATNGEEMIPLSSSEYIYFDENYVEDKELVELTYKFGN